MRHLCFWLLLLAVIYPGPAAGATIDPSLHIRNFAEVNDHLYRGAVPHAAGIRQLADAHVNLVVDLREHGPSALAEQHLAQKDGMQYVNLPLASLSAPDPAQLRRVLDLLESNADKHVFVHCWRGKDRTGTVIACYRIEHDHWTPQQALSEATQHGMSPLQRSMRSFILHFHPSSVPQPPLPILP